MFPFLSLPAEIRNQIYKLALGASQEAWLVPCQKSYRRTVRRATVDEYKHCFNGHVGRSASRYGRFNHYGEDVDEEVDYEEPHRLCPSLLVLNRQIYDEAAYFLYPRTFVIADTTALHAFLLSVGPSKKALVERIILKGYGHTKAHKVYNHPALSLLRGLPNLKEMVFDCTITWHWQLNIGCRGAQSIARQLYRDGFAWLHHVGMVKGGYGIAVNMIQFINVDKDQGKAPYANLTMGKQISSQQKREWFDAELLRLLQL